MDLLSHGSPDSQHLRRVFMDVCGQGVEPDGMTFDADSVEASEIREETDYGGVRIELYGRFAAEANMRLQVDVGFGDAIVPEPQEIDYPAMLQSLLPAPRLRVYPRDVVVAEKLQAMVHLGMSNSRMKDFFDLHFLSTSFPFNGITLSGSITATFTRRGTAVPPKTPLPLTSIFAADPLKLSQWQGFLRRSRLPQKLPLNHVVAQLELFLMPPLIAIARGEVFSRQWRPGGGWRD